jgi:hypothetical protein
MEGREIVVGKLCGSYYALRWLILAAIWAWSLALLFGTMPLKVYCFHLLGLVVIGACMSAIGVRVSLAAPTATKAMTIAVGLCLVALCLISLLALILVITLMLAVNLFWWSFYSFNPPPGLTTPFAALPLSFADAWVVTQLALYAVMAILVVIESRYRFDRIAGRMTGGQVEVAVDQFLHGIPMAPIPLDSAPIVKTISLVDPAALESSRT